MTVVPSYRRTNWFAGMVGIPSTTVSATATANWGYPSGGSALPLTFSKDCFEDATGGWNGEGVPTLSVEITINIKEKNPACSWPAHNGTPGNFGWLEAIDCKAKVAAGGWVYSDVGNNGPSSTCDPADWIALQNKSIMVPIFDDTNDLNGTKAMFHIVGIAAFKVTGYCLDSKSEYNVTQCPSNPRLVGKFTSYTDVTGDFSIAADAPHFGALTVELSA